MALVQITVSFQYPSTGYVSSTSGGAVNQLVNILQPPPINTPVSIINVATGNPATVFTDSTGNTTIGSLATDSGGNIAGMPWIAEGFYAITASPSGSFTGATLYWSAARPAVFTIADGSITCAKIAPDCRSYMVPTGGVLPFGGPTAPTGYLMCDGSQYSQTGAQAALYAVIGLTYNTGGETTGNFRVPDLRARFPLGASSNPIAGARGGSWNHTHSVPGLSLSSINLSGLNFEATVPGHNHSLSDAGGAAFFFDGLGLDVYWGENTLVYFNYNQATQLQDLDFNLYAPAIAKSVALPSIPLSGSTDNNDDTIISGTTSGKTIPAQTTGGSTTGTNNPPYLATNYIIRT